MSSTPQTWQEFEQALNKNPSAALQLVVNGNIEATQQFRAMIGHVQGQTKLQDKVNTDIAEMLKQMGMLVVENATPEAQQARQDRLFDPHPRAIGSDGMSPTFINVDPATAKPEDIKAAARALQNKPKLLNRFKAALKMPFPQSGGRKPEEKPRYGSAPRPAGM